MYLSFKNLGKPLLLNIYRNVIQKDFYYIYLHNMHCIQLI